MGGERLKERKKERRVYNIVDKLGCSHADGRWMLCCNNHTKGINNRRYLYSSPFCYNTVTMVYCMWP